MLTVIARHECDEVAKAVTLELLCYNSTNMPLDGTRVELLCHGLELLPSAGGGYDAGDGESTPDSDGDASESDENDDDADSAAAQDTDLDTAAVAGSAGGAARKRESLRLEKALLDRAPLDPRLDSQHTSAPLPSQMPAGACVVIRCRLAPRSKADSPASAAFVHVRLVVEATAEDDFASDDEAVGDVGDPSLEDDAGNDLLLEDVRLPLGTYEIPPAHMLAAPPRWYTRVTVFEELWPLLPIASCCASRTSDGSVSAESLLGALSPSYAADLRARARVRIPASLAAPSRFACPTVLHALSLETWAGEPVLVLVVLSGALFCLRARGSRSDGRVCFFPRALRAATATARADWHWTARVETRMQSGAVRDRLCGSAALRAHWVRWVSNGLLCIDAEDDALCNVDARPATASDSRQQKPFGAFWAWRREHRLDAGEPKKGTEAPGLL